MKFKLWLLGLGTTLSMSACTPYPLPQDVVSDDTFQIVAKVRCEARDALREIVLYEIDRYETKKVYLQETGLTLGQKIRKDPDYFKHIKIDLLHYDLKRKINYYNNSTINYDFTLQGTEANSQGFRFDLIQNAVRRVDTIGIVAQGDRSRQLKRNFEVSDYAIKLAQNVDDFYCSKSRGIELVYPMAGQKGIKDLIKSFLNINLDENLFGDPKTPNIRSMGDTISFKTTLVGNVSPAFRFLPLGTGLNVSNISVTNNNSREDLHQVIITITASPVQSKVAGKGGERPPSASRRESDGARAIQSIREKNQQDAIIQIGNSLSNMLR